MTTRPINLAMLLGGVIVIWLLAATDAHALTIAEQTSCESIPGASWDTSTETCTVSGVHVIPAGQEWSVSQTVTLLLDSGADVTVEQDGAIRVSGALHNDGTLHNLGMLETFGRGQVVNTGTIANGFRQAQQSSTAQIRIRDRMENRPGGLVDNRAQILLAGLGADTFANEGRLHNIDGTITLGTAGTRDDGILHNTGTVDNQGTIAIERGGFTNLAQVVNWGAIDVTGTLNNATTTAAATIDNRGFGRLEVMDRGRIVNSRSGVIANGSVTGRDSTSITNAGLILNEGTISDDANSVFLNEVGGLVTNQGTIQHLAGVLTNRGDLASNGVGSFGAPGSIHNHADIDNRGRLVNGHVLHNHAGGVITSHGGLLNGCTLLFGTAYCGAGDQSGDRTLTNEGSLELWGTTDNHGIMDSSGLLTNRGGLDNIGQLTNTGDLRNAATMHNRATATLDTTTGTLTNDGELHVECGGVVLGVPDGNEPLSTCTVTENLILVDEASCAQVAGTWTNASAECRVGTLNAEAILWIEEDVTLTVLHDLVVRERFVVEGTVDIRHRMTKLPPPTGFREDMEVHAPGGFVNRGTAVLGAPVWGSGTVANMSGATMTVADRLTAGLLVNRGEMVVEGRIGQIEGNTTRNTGTLLVTDDARLDTAGTFVNTASGVIDVLGELSNITYFDNTPTFANHGRLNNHGTVRNGGRFTLEAGSTFAHYDGARFSNYGYFGVREEASFWSEANTWFENAGDAFVESAGEFFSLSTIENAGDWMNDREGELRNLIGLSFHNTGTLINRGTIHNGLGAQHGRFENMGVLRNEPGGVILNGGGRFENTTTGLLQNLGSIDVGDGTFLNDGVVIRFPGSTLSGEISGAVPLAVPSSKEECKRGGWADLVREDGTPFRNQGDCVSHVTRR